MGFTKGETIGISVLGFILVCVFAAGIVVFIVNGGFKNKAEAAETRKDELEIPDYVNVSNISGCRWDQVHNVCEAHEQGLKKNGKFLARSHGGYLTYQEQYLWNFSALKFIGTNTFIITAEDYPCTEGTELDDCDQIFFFQGEEPGTGYFARPPHKDIFNRFALVRRKLDDPYYRYVNLRVFPHELCNTEECRKIRGSVLPYYLAANPKGFYFTLSGDDDEAIFEWDWDKEDEAPVRPSA